MIARPVRLLLWLLLALLVVPSGRAQQRYPRHPAPATREVAALSAPASSPAAPAAADDDDEYAPVRIYDPLEPVNRVVFKFNDGVYEYVFRPVSKGYVKVVPEPARDGLVNFFSNLRFPLRFVSDVFQGKFKRAGLETKKFYVNTIAGLGGFIRISDDVPSLANIPPEDVGQVFGVWGIPKGPYLVLPVLGPSTARDAVGLVGDYYLTPLYWDQLSHIDGYHWWWDTTVQTVDLVRALPGRIDIYDAQKKAALDPYIAVRSAYNQYRDAAIKQ